MFENNDRKLAGTKGQKVKVRSSLATPCPDRLAIGIDGFEAKFHCDGFCPEFDALPFERGASAAPQSSVT